MPDECELCGEPGPDLRMLRMSNMYDMSEASEKLKPVRAQVATLDDSGHPSGFAPNLTFWTVTTCKNCRSDFIGLVRKWCEEAPARRIERELDESGIDPSRNIPVRIDGATVMLTPAEYHVFKQSGGS